jgi:hypothetical protein
VAGVLISIVGFAVTIISVLASKKAAQRAGDAALEVRDKFLRTDTIMELSGAIAIMEEIKRMHRLDIWSLLPDRYSSVKRLLVTIRSSHAILSPEHRAVLLGAIQHFSDIEKKVERALASKSTPSNVAKLNEIVSLQLDHINEILAALRQEIGTKKNG